PFMRAYTELLVKTCHRRGAHAMGGMAAFIPNRRDPEVTAIALAKVREDKTRESGDGFDGSWVAHPDLVALCKEVFDAALGDGPPVTRDLVERIIREELATIRGNAGAAFDAPRYDQAVALVTEVGLADDYAEFLTIPAYERMP